MIFHQFWLHFQWVNCHQFWWFFYRNVVDSLKFSPFLVIYFSPFSMSKLSPILVIFFKEFFVDSWEFNGKWHQFLCEKMSLIDNFFVKIQKSVKIITILGQISHFESSLPSHPRPHCWLGSLSRWLRGGHWPVWIDIMWHQFFCEKKMSQILVIIFLKILKSVKIIAILVD